MKRGGGGGEVAICSTADVGGKESWGMEDGWERKRHPFAAPLIASAIAAYEETQLRHGVESLRVLLPQRLSPRLQHGTYDVHRLLPPLFPQLRECERSVVRDGEA